MPGLPLDSVSDSDLDTMLSEAVTAYRKALKAESYGVAGRTLSRPKTKELLEQISTLSEEKRRRGQTIDDVLLVEFGPAV